MNWDDMVTVGRVARAQGNRGEVVVNPETDFPGERFRAGSALYVRRAGTIEMLTVSRVRYHRGRPVVALEGIASMNDAEALAGTELRIDPDTIVRLSAGSFYRHELLGCGVETVDGHRIGVVTGVESGPVVDRLVVAGARGEILIPLAADICVTIDPPAKRILVVPPEGLLELNESGGIKNIE